MRELLPIALICAALLGCSKDDDNTPKCPEKTCAKKAERIQTSNGIIIAGEDCKNKAEPCKEYCSEHSFGNVN